MGKLKASGRPVCRALYPRARRVVALFLLLAIVLFLWPSKLQSGGAGAEGEQAGSAAVVQVDDGGTEVLARLVSGESLSGYRTALPEGAQREVPLFADALCSVDAGGVVVGFVLDEPSDSAFDQVKTEMAGKGWTFVSGGNQTGATFAKDGGTYRWATATCSEVGSGTAVVINARSCDE